MKAFGVILLTDKQTNGRRDEDDYIISWPKCTQVITNKPIAVMMAECMVHELVYCSQNKQTNRLTDTADYKLF